MKIKVGIVGGTGYTGVELLRLLVLHPNVEIKIITSRAEAGKNVADMFPNLRGHLDLKFVPMDNGALKSCDLVYFATPNGIAMQWTPELIQAGVRVIDLAADFRFKDAEEWQKWYGQVHACPELLETAVYGLPEVNRNQVKTAQLIANPGCYPTAVQLGFLPLLEQGLVDLDSLIADCKSGVSGAGRKANVGSLLCEAGENFMAYAVSGHRHQPEIKQGMEIVLSECGQRDLAVDFTFVPHLTPMARGIHATLYARLNKDDIDLIQLFENRFASECFVDVMPIGSHPETRSVRGANTCRISVHHNKGNNRVVILAVIDNLVKGAAGQAVQNMNIMFGLEETSGLGGIALIP